MRSYEFTSLHLWLVIWGKLAWTKGKEEQNTPTHKQANVLSGSLLLLLLLLFRENLSLIEKESITQLTCYMFCSSLLFALVVFESDHDKGIFYLYLSKAGYR